MKRALGRQEAQLLAYLQMRKRRTVRTGELTGPLRLTRVQERELFRRMARGRLIARVRRGLYLVPPQLPLGGAWSPNEALALNTLMDDRQGRYQVCGPNAFNRYGFDGQVPARLYAYNNRISGERAVGAVALTLIKVADERLGDVEQVQTAEGLTTVYSSRVRTLVDAVYDWSRFGSLPRAFGWIRTELKLTLWRHWHHPPDRRASRTRRGGCRAPTEARAGTRAFHELHPLDSDPGETGYGRSAVGSGVQ
jgi:predicted transcriptional regulator of viral defense system